MRVAVMSSRAPHLAAWALVAVSAIGIGAAVAARKSRRAPCCGKRRVERRAWETRTTVWVGGVHNTAAAAAAGA